nr:MAG TPA: hypothetical protein [Caudoviricetes sp.]
MDVTGTHIPAPIRHLPFADGECLFSLPFLSFRRSLTYRLLNPQRSTYKVHGFVSGLSCCSACG